MGGIVELFAGWSLCWNRLTVLLLCTSILSGVTHWIGSSITQHNNIFPSPFRLSLFLSQVILLLQALNRSMDHLLTNYIVQDL